MLERGKMERGISEIVDTESLVPAEHMLRKIDAAVDFNKIYDNDTREHGFKKWCGIKESIPRRLRTLVLKQNRSSFSIRVIRVF